MEYIDDVEYWQGKALEQQLRAVKAEAEIAAAALQQHADRMYDKYKLIKGVDRLEERAGKVAIVRAESKPDEVK